MKHEKGWAWPDADHFMVSELQPDGTYHSDHFDAAMQYVTDLSLACDCGAHVGTWTRLMSARFEHVVAVEPSPDTFEALEANLATFGCVNVAARNVALGARPGWVSLALDERNMARKNTGARYVQVDGPIPMVTIDSMALPSLGFLKVDVEGSELPCLLGARQTIAQCHPVILYEEKGFGVRFGVKRGEIETFLTSLGYRHLAKKGSDLIWGHA